MAMLEPPGLARLRRLPPQAQLQFSLALNLFPLGRAAAAGVLVLLAMATALVLVTSRPLADVEIASASLRSGPCANSQDCPGPSTLALSGTLGGVGDTKDAVVYVLIKAASGSVWTVGAETRPTESGDWSVESVALPPGGDPGVDVRAVLERHGGPLVGRKVAPASSEALPGSRVVRLTAEGAR